LWFAHNINMPLLYSDGYTFKVSSTKSSKGIQCKLLDDDKFWPSKFLLVFNTHLDANDVNNSREKQLVELYNFMAHTFREIDQEPWVKFDFTQCAVLLVGDFNMPSNGEKYVQLVEMLELKDLHKEFFENIGHQEMATHGGSNSFCPGWPARRIDYIFSVERFEDFNFLKVRCQHFKIERQPKGQELSDHWPQIASIVPAATSKEKPKGTQERPQQTTSASTSKV